MNVPPLNLVGVWTVILNACVFFYVLLDGFNLGVGMLYGMTCDPGWRAVIMNSIWLTWGWPSVFGRT